jgi:hypothetical protein
MADTFRVERRFCGPTDTANGGYTCGTLASFARGPVTVRLLTPVPLDTALAVIEQHGVLEARHGESPVAQARPGDVGDLVPPSPPPTLEEAIEAAGRYAGFHRHPAPLCFVCGPKRAEGDALRIFSGPLGAPGVVAAPWTPDASLDGGDGEVAPEFIWAALDCPGFAAAAPDMRAMLLGELTARVDRRVRIGEPCFVVGWLIGASGRKHYAGTALYDSTRSLCAIARAVWIEPRSA